MLATGICPLLSLYCTLFSPNCSNLVVNRLTGSIPSGVGNLAELTTLVLWGNKLTGSIPAKIGNLVFLNALYLAPNNLTGSIPESIGNLLQLTVL
ncbi:unnamed protein product [Closterium sp. NIES-54]